MEMLGGLYVDVHCYVIYYMVSSPLHVCGCRFHMLWCITCAIRE